MIINKTPFTATDAQHVTQFNDDNLTRAFQARDRRQPFSVFDYYRQQADNANVDTLAKLKRLEDTIPEQLARHNT